MLVYVDVKLMRAPGHVSPCNHNSSTVLKKKINI